MWPPVRLVDATCFEDVLFHIFRSLRRVCSETDRLGQFFYYRSNTRRREVMEDSKRDRHFPAQLKMRMKSEKQL